MKRYMMTLFAIFAWMGTNAMDYETARERAYYLTDKMAYELNLNDQQYNDAYEINLDYLLSINSEADLADARYLTYRNEDLRHILHDWQWTSFSAVDYLFRPLWWLNGGWHFPVYNYYAHSHYFYHRPRIYWDYRGGHGRFHYTLGFYHDRRPVWHGGLRGNGHHMTGHPNPHGGRYGHNPHERRGGNGFHFDHHNMNRGGHGARGMEQGARGNGRPNFGGNRPDGGHNNGNVGGNRPDARHNSGMNHGGNVTSGNHRPDNMNRGQATRGMEHGARGYERSNSGGNNHGGFTRGDNNGRGNSSRGGSSRGGRR